MDIRTKSETGGVVFLDIPELSKLETDDRLFFEDTTNLQLSSRFYKSLTSFIGFCIRYADDVFKGETFGYEQTAPELFVTCIHDEKQFHQYLHHALYVSRLYLLELMKHLSPDETMNYHELALTLTAEYEWLIFKYETHVKGSCATSTRHRTMCHKNLHEVQCAAIQLMFAECIGSLHHMDFSIVKPTVMFLVGRCLDVVGRNLAGYYLIVDHDNNPISLSGDVVWRFFCESNANDSSMLPVSVQTILKLWSWSNSQIFHDHLYASYVQFYALEIAGELINLKSTDNMDKKGHKARFERFLRKKNMYDFSILWSNPEDTKAKTQRSNRAFTKRQRYLTHLKCMIIKFIHKFIE